jgi:hypothetical protein
MYKKSSHSSYFTRFCNLTQLYVVEKRLSGLSADEIKLRRQERSSPILEKLYRQLKYHEDKVYPEGYIAKAIGYCLNQWDKLIRYIEDGNLRIDNNDAERSIKPFVVGRKNWLFSNTEGGAKASSIIYSIVETCKANKVNPYDYFKFILENIHKADTKEKLREMLPWRLDKDLLKRYRGA